MVNFKKLVVVLFVLSLFWAGKYASADFIVGSGGWQGTNTYTVNNNGMPYWDNLSSDGQYKNIGYCLSTNNCFNPAPGKMPYWGMNGGAADSNFYFQGSAGSNDAFALVLELAGYSSHNIFGWYKIDPISGKRIDGTDQIIFNGSNSAGDSAVIPIPSDLYGFYLKVPDTGKTYYTQSSNNSIGTNGEQHFSVFQDKNSFWFGMEDLSFCSGDKDYNDMVVHITTHSSVPVPEPSTVSLIAAGIIGLGILRRLKI
jgi:hypothetical protein